MSETRVEEYFGSKRYLPTHLETTAERDGAAERMSVALNPEDANRRQSERHLVYGRFESHAPVLENKNLEGSNAERQCVPMNWSSATQDSMVGRVRRTFCDYLRSRWGLSYNRPGCPRRLTSGVIAAVFDWKMTIGYVAEKLYPSYFLHEDFASNHVDCWRHLRQWQSSWGSNDLTRYDDD